MTLLENTAITNHHNFQVDDNVVKKKLPGRFFELNIHFGIFLGGQGDFSELFLGHMENFRGCMEDVSTCFFDNIVCGLKINFKL